MSPEMSRKRRKSKGGSEAQKHNFNSSIVEYTEYDLIHPEEVQFIEFARGCIFKCAFCSFPMTGAKTVDYLNILQENTKKKSKKPELVNNPHPAPDSAAPESGLDLLLLLDITDEEVIRL